MELNDSWTTSKWQSYGDSTNATTMVAIPGSFFNCRTSELSRHQITSQAVWQLLPAVHHAAPAVAAVEAVFFAIAFVWNLFILICYLRQPRLLKEPANLYLCNIALADFLLSVLVILISFVSEATKEFVFGDTDIIRCHFCEFLGFTLMFFVTMVLHTLAALSFDRFVLLSKPLQYKLYFSWKTAVSVLALIWFISFWVAIPPVLGFGQYEFNAVFANCHPRWTGQTGGINHINYILFAAVEAVVPIVILTVTNVWTFMIIKNFITIRLKRRRLNLQLPSKLNDLERRREKKDYLQQQKRLIRVCAALFIAHIINWTPTLLVVTIAYGVGPTKIPIEVYIFGWVCYLINPVAHPIIESLFIKELRHRFKMTSLMLRKARSFARTSAVETSRQSEKHGSSPKASNCMAELSVTEPKTPAVSQGSNNILSPALLENVPSPEKVRHSRAQTLSWAGESTKYSQNTQLRIDDITAHERIEESEVLPQRYSLVILEHSANKDSKGDSNSGTSGSSDDNWRRRTSV